MQGQGRGWGILKTANSEPVSTSVVALREDVGRIEVQIVGVIGIVRSRRPVETVGPHIANIGITVVTEASERN